MKQMQTGRTLIEMIVVLIIIGVLTIGALAGLTQAMTKFKTTKMQNDMETISSDVVTLYAWKRGYPSSFEMSLLCQNDIFPDGCDTSNIAYNPFGGEYTLTANQSSQTMTIETGSLPTGACLDLQLREWAYISDDIPSGCTSNPCCTGSDGNKTFTIILN